MTMTSSLQIFLAGSMLVCACCEAVGTPLVSRRAHIARTFEFPEQCLVEKDVTRELQKKQGADVIAAWQYTSTNGAPFAPLSIVVAKAGTFVNEEMHEKVSAYWKKLGSTGAISRVAIGDQADGYEFSTCGPGASGTLMALRFPARHVDVQIVLTVPGDPPLESTAETEEYHHFISTGGKALTDRLTECASQVAQSYNVMASHSNSAESVTMLRRDARENQTQRFTNSENVSSNKYASKDPVNQPSAPGEGAKRDWLVAAPILGAVIIAIVLLVCAYLRRRGGRQRLY